MVGRRHSRKASRLTRGLVLVGLCVAMAALAIGAVLPRIDLAASPQPRTPSGPTSTFGGSTRPGNSGSTSTTTTSTTTTTSPASGRPAALVQDGDSKTACITGQPGSALREAELVTGFTYDCIETFTDNDRTWAQWVNPWIAGPDGAGFRDWVAADPTGHQLIDTQNLIPDDQAADPDWTGACAAGDYNDYAAEFASNMVAAGFGYSIIRLGHEMNGDWETDSLGDTTELRHQWAECFAQEVTAMRAVPGTHFLFDWSINAGYRNIPLAEYYPGNAYVDIVGISFYDQSGYPLPPVGSPYRWQVLAGEPMGLNVVYAFAAAHDKPLGFGEWGTVTTQGDDANYVTRMGEFIAGHDVAYDAWFDANDLHIYPLLPSLDPRSVAAYISSVVKRH